MYESIKALQREEEDGDRMQFEDLRLLLKEHPFGPHIVLEGGLLKRVKNNALKGLLFMVARQESGWALALVLSVKFDDVLCTIDAKDRSGSTTLHGACRAGSLNLTETLVEAGAEVSAANDQGDTQLLAACRTDNLELAKMLVDAGAEVSSANDQGDTPLLAAMVAENIELAAMLVHQGADVTAFENADQMVLGLHPLRSSLERRTASHLLSSVAKSVSNAMTTPLRAAPISSNWHSNFWTQLRLRTGCAGMHH